MNTNLLAAGLIGFLLGGLVVSTAAQLERNGHRTALPFLQQPPDNRY